MRSYDAETHRLIYRRILESAQGDGIAFAFERMSRTPNTILAHRLVLSAEQDSLGRLRQESERAMVEVLQRVPIPG